MDDITVEVPEACWPKTTDIYRLTTGQKVKIEMSAGPVLADASRRRPGVPRNPW